MRLPHARGGVSGIFRESFLRTSSSPRTWGCFRVFHQGATPASVFPTHVGVFPPALQILDKRAGLPHARGGVSQKHAIRGPVDRSSPRTWGCFQHRCHKSDRRNVFPTHVGVFLQQPKRKGLRARLPHARGGVSIACVRQYTRKRSSPRTWGCFYRSLGALWSR